MSGDTIKVKPLLFLACFSDRLFSKRNFNILSPFITIFNECQPKASAMNR